MCVDKERSRWWDGDEESSPSKLLALTEKKALRSMNCATHGLTLSLESWALILVSLPTVSRRVTRGPRRASAAETSPVMGHHLLARAAAAGPLLWALWLPLLTRYYLMRPLLLPANWTQGRVPARTNCKIMCRFAHGSAARQIAPARCSSQRSRHHLGAAAGDFCAVSGGLYCYGIWQ